MMNAEEQEYMDYLIHNRMELTNQITRHLDSIDLLEKKLDLALDTLGQIAKFSTNSTDAVQCGVVIQQINEMDEVKDETDNDL